MQTPETMRHLLGTKMLGLLRHEGEDGMLHVRRKFLQKVRWGLHVRDLRAGVLLYVSKPTPKRQAKPYLQQMWANVCGVLAERHGVRGH
mmetsp:Transcript_12544/g.31600  ORF Transcript_12544/g.31600 Transcript_12544/m.31600 type:complete len:89 (+) Transcript_12544:1331-1597(+)